MVLKKVDFKNPRFFSGDEIAFFFFFQISKGKNNLYFVLTIYFVKNVNFTSAIVEYSKIANDIYKNQQSRKDLHTDKFNMIHIILYSNIMLIEGIE